MFVFTAPASVTVGREGGGGAPYTAAGVGEGHAPRASEAPSASAMWATRRGATSASNEGVASAPSEAAQKGHAVSWICT